MNKIKLGDICTIKGGYAFKSDCFVDNGVPIIRIGNITKNGINIDYDIGYVEEFWEENSIYRIEQNDILIAMSGATVGKSCINETENRLLLNQRVAAISCGENTNYKYVFYNISSDAFAKYIEMNSVGCAQPNISLKQIADFKISDIPLEQQNVIVEKIDSIESVIQYNNQLLAVHDETIKSRFIEMFGEPLLNPKGWELAKIGDVVTEVRYGTSRPAVEGGKYPYLRMNNLTADGHLDLTDLKYIDIPDNEIEKCIVRKGDVLFNRTNSVELVGKTCVFDLDEEMVIAGYIIRVRLNEKVLSEFLSAYMNSAILKEHLRGMAKGAVNQANINAQELQGIKIYLPPIELQQQFAEFVKQVEKAKSVIKDQLAELETLKKSLMQKYFR